MWDNYLAKSGKLRMNPNKIRINRLLRINIPNACVENVILEYCGLEYMVAKTALFQYSLSLKRHLN